MNSLSIKLILLFLTVLGTKAIPTVDLNGSFKTGEVTWGTGWRTNFGSCGFSFPPSSDFEVAGLSSKYMQLPPGLTNPNNHPLCESQYCLLIKGPLSSVVVKVSDTIQEGGDNISIADTVFGLLAEKSLGRVVMQWKFVDCATNPIGLVPTE